MRIAIEGCCHGELRKIYSKVQEEEKKGGQPIDLVLICGDFQAIRNESDLVCMAVPDKYKQMGTFWEYYTGQVRAPYPTIFIGGNHEASNYLRELFYGGWVCENIYYLGYAGVINFGGLRIGGISGIFNHKHYRNGHHEVLPYDKFEKKSAYHVREFDVDKVLQVQEPMDVFLSHDWPRGIERYGSLDALIYKKPFFRNEVLDNDLGSVPNETILRKLQPSRWFSAHLHVEFEAELNHQTDTYSADAQAFLSRYKIQQETSSNAKNNAAENSAKEPKITKFLSLDKCLPQRQFLKIIDIPVDEAGDRDFYYDMEWLSITKAMNKYVSTNRYQKNLPSKKVLSEEIKKERSDLEEKKRNGSLDLKIPHNFEMTAPAFDPCNRRNKKIIVDNQKYFPNPQTAIFCNEIGMENIVDIKEQELPNPERRSPEPASTLKRSKPNPDEIVIDEEDWF